MAFRSAGRKAMIFGTGRTGKGQNMTVDDLLAEAEALARPCYLLGASGTGQVAGFWGGERADRPNAVPPEATALQSIRHIMTVDARLLNELGLRTPAPSIGFAEVVTKTGHISHRILHSDTECADLSCDGLPLYATPAISLPPFEALCLYGSARIAEWLRGQGLQRHDYMAAADATAAMDYRDIYDEKSFLRRGDLDAVIGGWHQLWPDDDFYMPLEMRLAAITLRDAAPWYEIWLATGLQNWRVLPRII